MKKIIGAAVVAAFLAGASMPALAQQQSGCWDQGWGMMGPGMMNQGWGMMGPGMMGPGMMGPGMMNQGWGMMGGDPARYVDGRLAFLKTELHITSNQEKAWSAYADAFRTAMAAMENMHGQMMNGSNNANSSWPERMAEHQQLMTAQMGAMKDLSAAAKPLYDALTPEQRKAADNIMGMMW